MTPELERLKQGIAETSAAMAAQLDQADAILARRRVLATDGQPDADPEPAEAAS